MIYSGRRKGYPRWLASVNSWKSVAGDTIDGMHLDFSKSLLKFPVVS